MNYKLNLSGKKVLITGGAGGIGTECARGYLQNGADLILSDYNEKALSNAVETLKAEFPKSKIHSFACDVTNDEQVEKMIAYIKETIGSLDVLLNNAGFAKGVYSMYEEPDNWNRTLSINLTAPFFLSQKILMNFFKEQGRGKIVNMASLSSFIGVSGAAAYSSSKGGMLLMTRSLSGEWARFGVQVNCVCPGFVETPLIEDNLKNERWLNYVVPHIPQRRLAKPEDVVGAVLFLSSSLSDYITGTSIVVDGGYQACD